MLLLCKKTLDDIYNYPSSKFSSLKDIYEQYE